MRSRGWTPIFVAPDDYAHWPLNAHTKSAASTHIVAVLRRRHMSDLRQKLQTTLGNSYTLERELSGGGMSRVFAARETSLNRAVVIKVLSSDAAAGVSLDRFAREIQVVASLQQANIVPLLSAGDPACPAAAPGRHPEQRRRPA